MSQWIFYEYCLPLTKNIIITVDDRKNLWPYKKFMNLISGQGCFLESLDLLQDTTIVLGVSSIYVDHCCVICLECIRSYNFYLWISTFYMIINVIGQWAVLPCSRRGKLPSINPIIEMLGNTWLGFAQSFHSVPP